MIRSDSSRSARVTPALVVAGVVGLLACQQQDAITRSEALVSSGRTADAIALLREAIDESPDDDDLQFAYARALSAGGMRALADWPLRRAMRVARWRKRAGLAIAENAMALRNVDVAIEVLTELLEDDPDDVEILLWRALAYAATRIHLQETLDDVARVRSLAPDDLRAYRPEIQAYLHAAATDAAAKAIAELGSRLEEEGAFLDEETDRWYRVTRALFEQESLRFDEAEALWEDCLLRYPTSLDVVVEASTFFESQGNMDRSLAIIEYAVEATDLIEGLVFRVALAGRLNALSRTDEAVALLEVGTEASSPETALQYRGALASLYETAGRLDEALVANLQLLELAEEVGVANDDQRLAAGDLAIRSGNLERAEQIAHEIGTLSFKGLLEARIAHDRGRLEEAVAGYEEAARLWPDNAFLRYHEARALEQLGDLDRAIELYRHATRIDGAATDAQTRIALILESEGRAADALNVLATQASRAQLDLESELVFARLVGRVVAPGALPDQIEAWQRRQPAAILDGLSAVVRGLLSRGEPGVALSFLDFVDRTRLVESRGGPNFVRALLRAARAANEPDAALAGIIDQALSGTPRSAEWIAVDGYRAELVGDVHRALERYDSALAEEESLGWAIAARARLGAEDAPEESAAIASSLLEDARDDREIEEVATVVRALARAGHVTQSRRLYAELLDRRPYDVEAAIALCAVIAQDDSEATTVGRSSALSRRLERVGRACPAASQVEYEASPPGTRGSAWREDGSDPGG